MLVLMILIFFDQERHSAQLVILFIDALISLACGIQLLIMVLVIRKDSGSDVFKQVDKMYTLVYPTLFFANAFIMIIDFITELMFRYDVVYYPYF